VVSAERELQEQRSIQHAVAKVEEQGGYNQHCAKRGAILAAEHGVPLSVVGGEHPLGGPPCYNYTELLLFLQRGRTGKTPFNKRLMDENNYLLLIRRGARAA